MKKWWLILPLVFLSWGVALPAQAVCPVCTGAVIVGLGISRWLGVDDSITGLWIGGVLAMVTLWTINWLKKREINWLLKWWPLGKLTVWLGYAVFLFGGLYLYGSFGHPLNQLWGIDKLLLGMSIGVGATYGIVNLYYWLKRRNNNRSYFPFQRTMMTLTGLIILSVIFYFLSK
ncbi:MAG: hypothetical protein V1807_00225 [Patescibacteria group bacterium]